MIQLFSRRSSLDSREWQLKLRLVPWSIIGLLVLVAATGCLALTSAGEGDFSIWAEKQVFRLALGACLMMCAAAIDIRHWYRLTYPIFIVGVLSLILVDIIGYTGMGAQRWLDLGFMKIQPSELMKIALIMVLARYYHDLPPNAVKSLKSLLMPLLLIGVPVALVAIQPDLGTATKTMLACIAMLFAAGVPMWLFIAGGGIFLALMPVLWATMHDYQRDRVLTFLNPESDPFGAGYHITQSKIALGSGGFLGKGYLEGTQARLDFLPEKHTDFIFTLWAEEMGWVGGVFLMVLYFLLIGVCMMQAMRTRHTFGRLLIFGIAFNLSLYVMINIAMVMGLIPVVGVPLPFVSHGGTVTLSNMIGMGLILSVAIHRDSRLPSV
ncbi:MAG: rod shape-determining protein RodA [Pseudomonadota bacterium]